MSPEHIQSNDTEISKTTKVFEMVRSTKSTCFEKFGLSYQAM